MTYQADKEVVFATSGAVNGVYAFKGALKNSSGTTLSHSDMSALSDGSNAYVTGETLSSDFPTVYPLQPTLDGSEDAFVAKLTADGSALVYATYLGGRSVDLGRGIAVDTAGIAL